MSIISEALNKLQKFEDYDQKPFRVICKDTNDVVIDTIGFEKEEQALKEFQDTIEENINDKVAVIELDKLVDGEYEQVKRYNVYSDELMEDLNEDTEQNPDVQKRVANMRIKAENLGLECTAIKGGNGTTTMSIYFPNDKIGFFITVYPDKPTVFEYRNIKLTQDDFIHYVEKLNTMVEIVKAL